ncbi:peptidoglycan-recognition protein SB1-like [Sitodiplosis mosellana]|uniref:peptidoglycan-recognition protein SB1-like n=1 Tax=Sitodiplosis mosellana TaxID=263140 RepID=UPI002444F434|nr:peptidoglycan-recognition protein SB1-like [Sitodiplosis mosellana]XP_055323669.1 peptidoglycan-recognition protein SB1-like [Sitodiplosis mosellana]
MMMNNSNEFSSRYGYGDLDLENGYYGSCDHDHFGPSSSLGFIGQRAFVRHRLNAVDDRTPLLNGSNRLRPNCIDARVFSLGVLFIGGITVGGYMLYQQDRPWPMTTAGMWLDFVNREDWGAANFPIGRRLSSNNVVHVLLHHTATENCFDLSTCKMFVYNYQKWWKQTENCDIPFNYLVGGDGRAYEARGWSVESDYSPIHSNSSLSIAFIGNFTKTMPSVKQLDAARALILELKFQQKIAKNYHITGISYHKRAHHDAAALFQETSNWQCWDEVYTVSHS